MAVSFTATEPGALARLDQGTPRHVLVTGAAGNIGSYFAEHAHDKYRLRLMVQASDDASAIQSYGEVVTGDIRDLERMKEVCAGIDTVVHLAADPDPSATWSSLLPLNIVGTYNTFVAAKAAGCRRLIFASSIHAVSGYRPGVQVKTHEPVNPADLYGVTKCFGEALGRYMAEQEGLSVIAIRIGWFQPHASAQRESGIQMIDSWVSQRDLHQLIERSIDVESLKFAIFHGLSNNRFKRLDISDAQDLLGYDPQDDVSEEQPELKELNLAERLAATDEGQQSGIREEL
jgi:nucleoside-diphosphate-sugar epimerase